MLAQRINVVSAYSKAFEWLKLIAITGAAQVIIQGLGFISGILVIRLLPTYEYGLYTLVNMMIGTMTVLADGGISIGMMGEGGKVWQDRRKLGAVVASGLYLRRRFAIASFSVASVILFFLLRRHDASILMSLLLIVSLLPAFITTLTGTILEIAPKLHQDVIRIQKLQVGVNLGRLALLSLTLFAFPLAFIVILAGGLPQIVSNTKLRQISFNYVDQNEKPDPLVNSELLRIVKRIFPSSLYFCISGQITIWLVSTFGSTAALAQIGALSRIAMVFTVFHILFATLITPRFAKLPLVKSLLIKRFLQLQAGIAGLILCIITATWLFDTEILWILGNGYSGLEAELLLSIIGTCLILISGVAYTLYTCRGWVIKPIISIPVNIVAIVLSVQLIDVSTLTGILLLNILVAIIQLVMNLIFIIYKMLKVGHWSQSAELIDPIASN